jgi:AmmeMemoRadiSam system protein B
VPFRGIAAPSNAAFATPLGKVPVDVAAVEALGADALVSIDDKPHAPEHAIEVELPFLQALFGDLPIVPLVFGSTSAGAAAAAIERLDRRHAAHRQHRPLAFRRLRAGLPA